MCFTLNNTCLQLIHKVEFDAKIVISVQRNLGSARDDILAGGIAMRWGSKSFFIFFLSIFTVISNNSIVLSMDGNAGNNQSISADNYFSGLTDKGIAHWPKSKLPIKVFVSNEKFANQIFQGASPQTILIESFDEWTEASKGYLKWQLVNKPNSADITCFWTNNVLEGKKNNSGVLEGGVTHGTCFPTDKGIELQHASITICLCNPDGSVASLDEMKRRCLHEVGHALGIMGHSSCKTDVMFYSTSIREVNCLSNRDVVTLCKLYNINGKRRSASRARKSYDYGIYNEAHIGYVSPALAPDYEE
jgi:predicted Zn-dependent protease